MTSKFLKVKCEKCKNEQMVFEKAASHVKCLVCGEVLAEPTGGRARLSMKLAERQEKPAAGKKASQEKEAGQEMEGVRGRLQASRRLPANDDAFRPESREAEETKEE